MANLTTLVATMRAAKQGENVRDAIADTLEAVNVDNIAIIQKQAQHDTKFTELTQGEANALASADAAADSEVVATAKAGIATTQAGISTTKATEAAASKTAAETAQGIAVTAKNDTVIAKTAAQLAETNSKASEVAAEASKVAAAGSAGVATTKAGESAASAAAALASEQAAALRKSETQAIKDAAVLALAETTDEAEVIEARKGKSSLGEKISEIDSQLADIIQPDINTMSLTTLEQAKSVSDSYGGIAEFTINGLTINQSILNGNFENGTGWTAKTSTFTTAANEASVLAYAQNGCISKPINDVKVGDVIFLLAEIKADTPNILCLIRQGVTPYANVAVAYDGSGIYKTICAKITIPQITAPWIVELRDTRTSGWTNFFVKNVMVIKASQTSYVDFTTTQMLDMLKSTYFEGLRSVQGLEVVSKDISDTETSRVKITCTDPTKFDLAQVPNGVANTIEYKDGTYRAVKRVARYVLQSADITAISNNTNTTTIQISNNAIIGASGFNVSDLLATKMITSASRPRNNATFDTAYWVHWFGNAGIWSIAVPVATYTNLAAAQSALTGTIIYYQLAIPVIIEEKDFTTYGIEVQGSLSSNNNYTEYYIDNYDIFPSTLQISYATNIAKAVDSLKDGVITLKEFQTMQNLINLEFDVRIATLEP